jgi:hypothetical protein
MRVPGSVDCAMYVLIENLLTPSSGSLAERSVGMLSWQMGHMFRGVRRKEELDALDNSNWNKEESRSKWMSNPPILLLFSTKPGLFFDFADTKNLAAQGL